jgi:hypothetical protein
MLDRLTRSRVVRSRRLEDVEDVLGARCRPEGEQTMVRVGERPAPADRHETGIANLWKDQGERWTGPGPDRGLAPLPEHEQVFE